MIGLPFNKKIFFYASNFYPSAICRGFQVSDALCAAQVDAKCISEYNDNILDAVIVFVKFFNQTVADKLKQNNNIIVYDVVDDYCHGSLELKKALPYCDAIIFPNNYSKEEFTASVNKYDNLKNKWILGVIYHHWDPRIEQITIPEKKAPNLCFFGAYENMGSHTEYQDVDIINVDTDNFFETAEVAVKYAYHVSIRKENSLQANYKPNVKLSNAAAMNANAIFTKDRSFVELMDESYPFYTDGDANSVAEKILFARDVFKAKEWNYGLEMMMELKERTTLAVISKEYVQFLNELL